MNILDRNPDPSETFTHKGNSFYWRDIARYEKPAPNIVRLVFKDKGKTPAILTDLDGKLKAKLDNMEKVNLTDGRALRTVAVKLQKELCPDLVSVPPWKGKDRETKQPAQPKPAETLINVPLDFELKGLNSDHPHLKEMNLTRQTIDYFGLGFCSRGSLKDQIAIPLRDATGQLIGYAGRTIEDSLVPKSHRQYSFPAKREHEGKVFDFQKSLFLYNGFRIKSPADELIVVGDFASVWWLHQNGYPGVVAVMGSECSERQAERIVSIVKVAGRVWIMPDETGNRLAESLLPQISPHRFVRWVQLERGCQPFELSGNELRSRLLV